MKFIMLCIFVSLSYLSGFGQAIEKKNSKPTTYFSEVYPNPASNNFSFQYTIDSETADVFVYNILGDKVATAKLIHNGQRFEMNVQNLENGMYFFTILIDNKIVKTTKFIIYR